jgi:hypothetical protein
MSTPRGMLPISPRFHPSPCENPAAPFFGEVTHSDGHCRKWDSFDVETALAVLATAQRGGRS